MCVLMIDQTKAKETGKMSNFYLFTVGAEDEIFSEEVYFLQTLYKLRQEALVTGQDNKSKEEE